MAEKQVMQKYNNYALLPHPLIWLNMRKALISLTLLVIAALTGALLGCARQAEPLRDARQALGTIVSVTAWPADNANAESLTAIDSAYSAMSAVEGVLNVHDPDSVIATIPAGSESLPAEASAIISAVERLGVEQYFSPHLFEVVALYDFEGEGRVPTETELRAALIRPRYDFGGAAKGLALDEAASVLARSPAIGAALVSAGSTTITTGEKPDGSPWRIGVEHPREPGQTIAAITARGEISVSTSGDYQRYFMRDEVRYHHILDPTTGRPAQGLRSLTVVGEIPGLDSDILSTALFVMGQKAATTYARKHGLGLVLVTDQGETLIVDGPAEATWQITQPD